MAIKKQVKREIISKAARGRNPMTRPQVGAGNDYPSRASRGIYQSGPWSDSLSTTHVKIDKKGLVDKVKSTVQGPPVSGAFGGRIRGTM